MGVFAEWQPRYAQEGIATFPTIDKKPCVKGWQKIGPKGSAQLAFKFPEANELAFLAGPKSGLTIIDVDTRDEDIWRDALKRFGETNIMVRTGSGNLQLWYRHNGEPRDTASRLLGCVDVLGGGQVLGPPSERGMGYQLLRGTIEDIANLPFARNIEGAPAAAVQEAVARGLVKAGGRNKALYDYLRGQARYTDDLQALIDVGRTYADENLDRHGGHPFTDDEVQRVAKSVWDWTERKIAEGTYFVGTGRRISLSHEAVDTVLALGPHAVALYLYLQRRFGGMASFYIANDTRSHMPDGEWPLRKLQDARKALLDAGIIKQKHKASSYHGAAVFQWES